MLSPRPFSLFDQVAWEDTCEQPIRDVVKSVWVKPFSGIFLAWSTPEWRWTKWTFLCFPKVKVRIDQWEQFEGNMNHGMG